MRLMRIGIVFCVLLGAAMGTSQAADVALFANTSYVGYSPGSFGDEASNVEASLNSLGHTVSTFTGIAAADFTNALSGQDVLVIPELENGDLNGALDGAARTAIANFVNGGGIFIGFGSSIWEFLNLTNAVFGFSLSSGGNTAPYALNAGGASGTPFAGGPASLPYNNDTSDISQGSLPPSTRIIYNNGANVGVFMAPYGSGWVIFLGWDWYNAAPTGSLDGGWLSVLDAAVGADSQGPVTAIPTLNEWGMIFFILLIGAGSVYFIKKRGTAEI